MPPSGRTTSPWEWQAASLAQGCRGHGGALRLFPLVSDACCSPPLPRCRGSAGPSYKSPPRLPSLPVFPPGLPPLRDAPRACWRGRLALEPKVWKEGVACASGRKGGVVRGGHLLRDPPSPHNSPALLQHRVFPMLPRISQASAHAKLCAHTHLQLQAVPETLSGAGPMPRSQPWVPCSGEGQEAQRAPVFIYLFEGPAFIPTGSDSPPPPAPGAWSRETLLPGPLMCEGRDGEMVLGGAPAVGCVCAWGEPR